MVILQGVDDVLTECRSGDYDHLLCTLMDHCEDPDDEEEEEEEEEEDVEEGYEDGETHRPEPMRF